MALWIDDQMPYAASTVAAGNSAIGALTRMSAWSSAQLADGRVPAAVARTMASARELASLAAVGLVTERADAYVIVDYLRLNPSRDQVLAERERRRSHAQTAARARWGTPADAAGMPGACGPHGTEHRKPDAPFPSLPFPSPEKESAAPAASAPRPSRRRPETPAPQSSATPEDIAAWCGEWNIPPADPEAIKMIDHARTNDRRCRDWSAAWRTWQRRAAEYGPRRPPRGPGGQPVDETAPWMRGPEGT